jgi:hypothetical protein
VQPSQYRVAITCEPAHAERLFGVLRRSANGHIAAGMTMTWSAQDRADIELVTDDVALVKSIAAVEAPAAALDIATSGRDRP